MICGSKSLGADLVVESYAKIEYTPLGEGAAVAALVGRGSGASR